MSYLLATHWVWLALALIVGLATGLLTFVPGYKRLLDGAVASVVVAAAVAAVVALLKWLPGRPGYRLEVAVLMFTAYAIGCLLGWLVKRVPATETVAVASAAAGAAALSPSPARTAAPDDERRATESKAAEDARRAAELKAAEDARRAVHPGAKPVGLAAAPAGGGDNLKLIKGIGPKNEKACNDLGVYRFAQIADWTSDEAKWVGHQISFPGRIEREHWIQQARLLAAGGDTDYSRGVKKGSVEVK